MTKNRKTAIVTGGAVRVGRSISISLAERGYDVLIIYNSSEKEALSAQSEIEKLGKKCHLVHADLSDSGSIEKIFRDIEKRKIDNISLLVNNASIFERYSFLETYEKLYNRNMDINFKAPFFLSQAFVEYSKKNKISNANVINILDTNIVKSNSPYFIYLLSKKILHEFTIMAAAELGKEVRFNSVSLGSVIPAVGSDDGLAGEKIANLPMKKRASLEDMNSAIKYLDESNYLTGQNIFVDSGQHLI